ncbi:MAG: YiiX/YebB-like N1pC/P60 family cysteine hydrolase, partial [Pyrinomonadaceae bacterium]
TPRADADMSLDPNAVRLANQQLWKAHPELKGRALTTDPADAALRAEWHQYYKAATTASAPPPTTKPATPVLPPPSTPVVNSCPVAPAPITINDCNEIEKHVQEGDIVLRGNDNDEESAFLSKLSGCKFSHAGVVARNAQGDLVVVDAYPGRGAKKSEGGGNTSAIGEQSVKSFFCDHDATQGLVARPRDSAAAKKAAQWAYDQIKDPDYTFDLFDAWNKDPKRLYCADFVHQSYQNAGVDLVPAKMDFLSPANKKNTLQAVRDLKPTTRALSDSKLESELLKKSNGSEYITPCQVAQNAQTDKVVDFAPKKGSGSGGGKKSN